MAFIVLALVLGVSTASCGSVEPQDAPPLPPSATTSPTPVPPKLVGYPPSPGEDRDCALARRVLESDLRTRTSRITSVAPLEIRPGTTGMVEAAGFPPGASVRAYLTPIEGETVSADLGRATVQPDGTVRMSFTVPLDIAARDVGLVPIPCRVLAVRSSPNVFGVALLKYSEP